MTIEMHMCYRDTQFEADPARYDSFDDFIDRGQSLVDTVKRIDDDDTVFETSLIDAYGMAKFIGEPMLVIEWISGWRLVVVIKE